MPNSIIAGVPACPKPTASVAEQRAAVIFNDISTLAEVVERLGVLLVATGAGEDRDTRDEQAYQEAIKALSAQIGLLGDVGAAATGGFPLKGIEPQDWLLPPVYPR